MHDGMSVNRGPADSLTKCLLDNFMFDRFHVRTFRKGKATADTSNCSGTVDSCSLVLLIPSTLIFFLIYLFI